MEVFIQTHIGHSLGKLCRDKQYWHSFSDELEILLEKVKETLPTHTIRAILNKPYVLKNNKRKSGRSRLRPIYKLRENISTISFFHFLTKDMCNYWPRLHDEHFTSTWNVIKIILKNGAMPLLQYKGSTPIYSYECIILLSYVFGKHYDDNIHKITELMQYILSFVQNHHFHPPLFTFYVNNNTLDHNTWLYLHHTATHKSELNTLSPALIVLFLQRNHILFELRDTQTNELIDDEMQYLCDIDAKLIKSFDSSLVISLFFMSFMLPQIRQKVCDILYECFMSSKCEILRCLPMDVLCIIMEYTLITDLSELDHGKLLPVIPTNINERELIMYVLEQFVKLNNKQWCQWISDTVFPVLNTTQIEQFKHNTFTENHTWNGFFVANCNYSFVFEWMLVFGGSLYEKTIRCLIRSNYSNLEHLQIIFSREYYSFDSVWMDAQLLMTIFSDCDLDKSILLFICNHICDHLNAFGKFKNGFDIMQSVFRSDRDFNISVLNNISFILSNDDCIKLKLNASVNFSYLYKNHCDVLLYLVEYDMLDFMHCVEYGDLTSTLEQEIGNVSCIWMWIKQRYKECNNDEIKSRIRHKVLDIQVDTDLFESLLV